jgi:hypothetical protein
MKKSMKLTLSERLFGCNLQLISIQAKIKHRVLSQVISPASSTYTYDLKLSDQLEFRESKPAVGITLDVGGFGLCQVFVDERTLIIREKLPLEALQTILRSEGYLEPIYISKSAKGIISSELQASEEIISGVNPAYGSNMSWNFHHQVLRRVSTHLGLKTEEFREINRSLAPNNSENSSEFRPQPLYVSTALEIGILSNPKVPSLVFHLLGSSSTSSAKYLQKWLICPPSYYLAQHFRSLLSLLSNDLPLALPRMSNFSLGKIVSLLTSSRCNAATFYEISENLDGVQKLLTLSSSSGFSLSQHLLSLVAYESGVAKIDHRIFLASVEELLALLKRSVHENAPKSCREQCGLIPEEFFQRNEETFAGIFVPGNNDISLSG